MTTRPGRGVHTTDTQARPIAGPPRRCDSAVRARPIRAPSMPLPKFTETVEALEREALSEHQGVVRQLDRAVEAVTHHDAQLAGQVLAGEPAAQDRDRRLQDRMLAALASHRAAPDLQMLASLLHVLRGLRRIRGQCSSMARLASTNTPATPEATALHELVESCAALTVSTVWLARGRRERIARARCDRRVRGPALAAKRPDNR